MNKDDLQRYFVAGSQDFPTLTLSEYEAKIVAMMQTGITAYQFREKGAGLTDSATRLALARRLQAAAKAANVRFFIDDDVDLALAIGADGIHVGQDDRDIRTVIAETPAEMIVGLSVRNVAEMQAAQAVVGLDYLGVGPIFATTTKADAAAPLGLAGLTTVLAHNEHHLPTVGIGGISLATFPALARTGLDGVAVVSLLSQAPDATMIVQEMTSLWGMAE